MGLRSHSFHRTWLRVAAIIIGVGGPIFSLGALPETAEPARLTLDILDWPVDAAQTYADPTVRFLSAVAGGFLVGWGVTVWMLAGSVHAKAPEAVRRSVVAGMLAWFVFDSAGSIAAGAPSNALFNVVVLLIGVGPLWLPARE